MILHVTIRFYLVKDFKLKKVALNYPSPNIIISMSMNQ